MRLKLKPPPLARLAEARYSRFLTALMGMWRARVLAVFEETPDVPPTRAELETVWSELTTERTVLPILKRVLHEADQASALYWRKLARVRAPRAQLEREWLDEQLRILGTLGRYQIDSLVGATRGDAREPKAVREARKANVALIQGLDLKQHLALVDLLKGAQATGERHETLVGEVQRITGAGLKRAKLIARDQTVKHNAAVNEAQAKASGIVEYTWRSTHDKACRPMHRDLDGTVHRYDDPPITNEQGDRNNPGEDYNCRCQAEPKPPQEMTDLFGGLADPEFESLGFGEPAPKPETQPEPAPTIPRARPVPTETLPAELQRTLDKLEAGASESEISFLRTGYRPALKVYPPGATAEEVEAIATGKAPPLDGINPLPPIKLAGYPDGTTVLVDGRHRLEAAQTAGAKRIRAKVIQYDEDMNVIGQTERNIPVFKPDAEKKKLLRNPINRP